jgi:hypothetical protein
MIKPSGLIMAAAMAAVSIGTYYGLEMLPEGVLPAPIGRAPKDAPPEPGVKPELQEVASAAAAVEPAPAPAAEQPVTEQDLAEEPPPEEPAPQAQAAAAPEPQAAPEPEPEPEPAQPAAKTYSQPPALVDEPEPAKPKPAPAPKKQVTVAREDSEAPKTSKPKPPEADVIKPWWPESSKLPANQLKLQYAGQVQGEQAIALLFSAPLNLETVKQHAQIKTESGENIKGGWELGKNPRLAVFRGVQSGRYTVILSPQVADAKGFMLGQTLQGPVYIQAPQAQ